MKNNNSQKINTSWTAPKTTLLQGMNDLRKCLAGGHRARLIRAWNHQCEFPQLLDKNEQPKDFREYEFSYGTLRTKEEIRNDNSLSDFEKTLSLEYHAVFGTEEAMNRYYATGELSKDNFNGMGRSHLVRVVDMVEFLLRSIDPKDQQWASNWMHYIDETDNRHFYDTFRLKSVNYRKPKTFKHKLWVVQMLDKDEPLEKLSMIQRFIFASIVALVSPLKYFPERQRVDMGDYIWTTYRIGSVTNGFTVEIHRGKKFSFKAK
jgi:hypothetical protein